MNAVASTAAALLLAVPSPAQTAPTAGVAAAAPFNQPYSTSAHAEVLHLNAISGMGLPGVADLGLGISEGTTSGSPRRSWPRPSRPRPRTTLLPSPTPTRASRHRRR